MLLLALALAAASPSKFDLECDGPATTAVVAPYRFRYVIDLDSGTYCKGDDANHCQVTGRIVDATATTIRIHSTHTRGVSVEESIDRQSGLALMLSTIGPVVQTQSGYCKPTKFSGFGPTRF